MIAPSSAHRQIRRVEIWMLLAAWALATPASGGLRPLEASELAEVQGAAGISIALGDVMLAGHTGELRYTDTDTGNSLAWVDVSLHDGAGKPAHLSTTSPASLDVLTLDTPAGPEVWTRLEVPGWKGPFAWDVGQVTFAGHSLGSLAVGPFTSGAFDLWATGHGSGVNFSVGARGDADQAAYTYNDAGGQLAWQGIHWAATSTGAPEDPSGWGFDGRFRVGDPGTGSAARLDVVSNPATGTARVVLQAPMSGSLRVENLRAGPNDLGPMVIDGLTIHELEIRLPGS